VIRAAVRERSAAGDEEQVKGDGASMVPGTEGPHDPLQVRITLSPRADSVTRARHWARGVVEAWQADELEWALSQLLTEVVTNAVLHAGTEVVVVLRCLPGRHGLRCEVSDASPSRLRRRHHSADATTGRGLVLLEQLSDAWGVQTGADGKTVWFEVSAGSGGGRESEDIAALLELFAADEEGVAPAQGGPVLAVPTAVAA
jgi:anti-sigma regulatory factor (Ser/Thr protein kinase)